MKRLYHYSMERERKAGLAGLLTALVNWSSSRRHHEMDESALFFSRTYYVFIEIVRPASQSYTQLGELMQKAGFLGKAQEHQPRGTSIILPQGVYLAHRGPGIKPVMEEVRLLLHTLPNETKVHIVRADFTMSDWL